MLRIAFVFGETVPQAYSRIWRTLTYALQGLIIKYRRKSQNHRKSILYVYKRRVACVTYQAYNQLAPEPINQPVQKSVSQRSLRDNMKLKLTLFGPGFFYRLKVQKGVFRDPLKSQEPLKVA